MENYYSPDEVITKTYLLINCLNLLGGSENAIKFRVGCFKTMETIHKIANLNGEEVEGYFLGSQIEGCTLVGMNSDEDIMFVNRAIKILQNIQEIKPQIGKGPGRLNENGHPDKHNESNSLLLGQVSEDDATPGYAKIMVVNNNTGKPLKVTDENPLAHLCDVSDDGFVFLSCDKLQNRMEDAAPFRHKHGPALTEDATRQFTSSDLVEAIWCPSWPKSAGEWVSRKRQIYGAFNNIHSLVKRGFYLVPVSSSHNPSSTEWRISFTLIERELIWHWNIIQYKTFMILKIIKRNLLEPSIPNVISSYHLKTLMFWMSEERNETFWRVHNFSNCIQQCLDKLLEYIQSEMCPHYFIRENNLLKNKLTTNRKKKLQSMIWEFRCNFWRDVFQLQILHKVSQGMELVKTECFDDLQTACFRSPLLMNETMNLRLSVLMSFATSAMKPAFQLITDTDMDACIRKHENYKKSLSKLHSDDPENLELINAIQCMIDISLGSQICSKAYQTTDKAMHAKSLAESEKLLRSGLCLDTSSGVLKLATFNVLKRDYQGALMLVNDVLNRENTIPLSGFEPINPENLTKEFIMKYVLKEESVVVMLRNVGALEVIFLPCEFYMTLDVIKYEIIRAIGATNYCSADNPARWVVLDATFYALLLKFYVYYSKNSQPERDQTLLRLRQYVKTQRIPVQRRVVALNIVGHCLLLCGEIEWAIDVFKGSLILQNQFNSAAWHLAVIAWKEFDKVQNRNC